MVNITQGVLLHEDAEKVRVGLRIYFTVILILVAYLGSRICAIGPRLALQQHKRVPVMHLTGWLSTFDAARTMWLSRSNPLGFMGILMLLSGSLLTITDFAVSGLVVTREVPARCQFDTDGGDFLIFPRSNTSVFPHFPGPNNYVSLMVKAAADTSKRNGGARGIYKKVNDRATKFHAEASDLYGTWNCARVDGGESIVYPANIDPLALVVNLVDRGLAFNLNRTGEAFPGTPNFGATLYDDPALNLTHAWFSNMVVMSSNAKEIALADGPGSTPPSNVWDVRISVEDGEIIGMRSEKSMATYGCSMDAPDAEWVMKATYAILLMKFWRTEVSAQVYQGVAAQPFNEGTRLIGNVEETLEDVLNNMIMTTGMIEARGKELIDDMSQGCLVEKTWIPWPVVFLFLLAALLLFGVAGYAGYLVWKLDRNRDKYRQASKNNDQSDLVPTIHDVPYAPVGFLSWMKHAGKRRGDTNELSPDSEMPAIIKSRSLKHYDFALDEEKGRTILVARNQVWPTDKQRRSKTFDVAPTVREPRKRLRKTNTMYYEPSTGSLTSTKNSDDDPQSSDGVTNLATPSAETLVPLPQSPSIDTQRWSNTGETVGWAGGLRQELERVGSRDGLVHK